MLAMSCSSGNGNKPATTTSPSPTTATAAPPTTAGSTTPGSGVATWPGSPVSSTAIPLGDGKVTTASPKAGYIYSCTGQFGGGAPEGTGPWVDTAAGTWNATTKIHVQGAQSWANASHSFAVSGSDRTLQTNDLPTGATTGTFPISTSGPAYQYDRNPNRIAAQSFDWTVPANPSPAESPGCLGLGAIGVSANGVVIFDALDAKGRDAGAHEVQDACEGHPQQQGVYHYHTYSTCLSTAASQAAGSSTLVGYMLDGYGIFLERDSHGNLPTDADLDPCHGRTSAVMWDGRVVTMYHYDITAEYPYTAGCFHGTAVNAPPGG